MNFRFDQQGGLSNMCVVEQLRHSTTHMFEKKKRGRSRGTGEVGWICAQIQPTSPVPLLLPKEAKRANVSHLPVLPLFLFKTRRRYVKRRVVIKKQPGGD